jgi:hypothetical protein
MGRAGQTEEGAHHSPVHPRDLYCEETVLPATWNNMDAARVYEEMIQVKPGFVRFKVFCRAILFSNFNVKPPSLCYNTGENSGWIVILNSHKMAFKI